MIPGAKLAIICLTNKSSAQLLTYIMQFLSIIGNSAKKLLNRDGIRHIDKEGLWFTVYGEFCLFCKPLQ